MGCDYNPEQWPERVWAQDVVLMREAGITFATVGVFAWALLEPEQGRFEFGWLDRAMDLLAEGGIAVNLATATASPPPWLSRRYPQTLPVDREGRTLWPGGRQAWCPSSPVFRERAMSLVEAMATRYAEHPALAMWHVSNELGCHNGRCYCDVSAAAFQTWLRARYGDLDTLNEVWATSFWSQRYGDWAQILPPRLAPTHPNPTQSLDFARFSSDALLEYYLAERDLLRRITPDVPVTTNFMTLAHFSMLDYWRFAPEQDVISTDHYLVHIDQPTENAVRSELAFSGDLTRSLAGGGPWFLMEHSTSAVNWQPVNRAKAPGELLRTSLGHLARGADAVGYFQWRAGRAGAEKFHSGLVPHAGTDTKVWREVVQLGGILRRSTDLAGTRVHSQVGLLFDWPSRWACDLDSHPSSLVRAMDAPLALHGALWRQAVTVDPVAPTADLSAYRLLVVPTLYLVEDAAAATLHEYVAAGGHVVITYFSGIVDQNDHIRLGGYPGAFRDLLGIRTEEFFPLDSGQVVTVQPAASGPGTEAAWTRSTWTGSLWTELTHLDGATAVARYVDGPLPGQPALTRHAHGRGVAWYLGTALDDAALSTVLGRVCRDAGVQPVASVPAGVEVVRRSGDGRSFLFVLNHTPEPVRVEAHGHDLVTDTPVTGAVRIAAGGCAIIREGLVSTGSGGAGQG